MFCLICSIKSINLFDLLTEDLKSFSLLFDETSVEVNSTLAGAMWSNSPSIGIGRRLRYLIS